MSLNPDLVTEVQWWEHPDFADKTRLAATELVAFKVLNPALRSHGGVNEDARQLSQDAALGVEMRALFEGDPSGTRVPTT